MSSTSLPVFPETGSSEYTGVLYAYSHLTMPVALLDSDGTLLFLNEAALNFFNVSSIQDIVGPTTDDWHGRLVQVESPSVSGSGREEEKFYSDKETGRVYYRHSIRLPKRDGGNVRLETLHDVTSLYEGDERVKKMIDAAPLCCNYWNKNLENIDCNLEAAKLFDLPDKKAYLERFQELSPELQPNGRKSADEAKRHIANAFQDGYDRFEWMHQKLNGDLIPAEITLVKVQDRDGDVVLGYTRDLRSAKSVADVDDIEWIMNIFNSLPFPIGVASASGKWMFMNKPGLDLMGAESVADIGGVSSADWGGRLEPLPRDADGDDGHYLDKRSEKIYRRADAPLKDSFGGLVGRVETLQDVTRLYETEERIRAMIDAAPLCCNFWDSSLANIECNLEAAKLFDLPDKKAYLDRFFELSPEFQPNGNKSSDEAQKHITKAFKDGFDRFEWMHQKLNGEPVPSEITLVRVNLREGDVVLGYTRDLRGMQK